MIPNTFEASTVNLIPCEPPSLQDGIQALREAQYDENNAFEAGLHVLDTDPIIRGYLNGYVPCDPRYLEWISKISHLFQGDMDTNKIHKFMWCLTYQEPPHTINYKDFKDESGKVYQSEIYSTVYPEKTYGMSEALMLNVYSASRDFITIRSSATNDSYDPVDFNGNVIDVMLINISFREKTMWVHTKPAPLASKLRFCTETVDSYTENFRKRIAEALTHTGFSVKSI